MPNTRIVAVVGAQGGVGTSLNAAAIAHGLTQDNVPAVLVDLNTGGGGIEVQLCVEGQAGARWPELADARGDLDGQQIASALPRWGNVPVLSVSRLSAAPLDDDVVLDVCSALLRSTGDRYPGNTVVLDLPRPGAWTPAIRALLADADVVIPVVPATISGVAGAISLTGALGDVFKYETVLNQQIEVVVSPVTHSAPSRVEAADIAANTGYDILTEVKYDHNLAGRIERGQGPDLSNPTPLRRLGQTAAEHIIYGRGPSNPEPEATAPEPATAIDSASPEL